MALFSKKKNTETKDEKALLVENPAPRISTATVLVRPRITEKASLLAETNNVYSFEIEKSATKHTVMRAIKEMFNVIPRKVTVVNLPRKKVMVRGKLGYKGGGKYARVFLKKGEKIEIV